MNPFDDWTDADVSDALSDMEFSKDERELICDCAGLIASGIHVNQCKESLGRLLYGKLRDWAIANADGFDLPTHADGIQERIKDAA